MWLSWRQSTARSTSFPSSQKPIHWRDRNWRFSNNEWVGLRCLLWGGVRLQGWMGPLQFFVISSLWFYGLVFLWSRVYGLQFVVCGLMGYGFMVRGIKLSGLIVCSFMVRRPRLGGLWFLCSLVWSCGHWSGPSGLGSLWSGLVVFGLALGSFVRLFMVCCPWLCGLWFCGLQFFL